MDRRVFTAFLLAFVVVGLIVLTFAIFQPFLLALLWAAVLATVTYQPYEWLCERLKGRRALASLCMTVLVLVVLLGPFFALTLLFYEDAAQLVAGLSSEQLQGKLDRILQHELVRKLNLKVEEAVGERMDAGMILDHLSGVVGKVASVARDAAAFLFRLFAGIFFVLLSIFYFYRDGPKVVRVARELLPIHEEDRDEVIGDIHGAVVAAVRGGLLTATVQGLLAFVIYLVLGLGQPFLWAAVTALASLIPLVGTALVWVPMAGWFLYTGEIVSALVLAGYGVAVIGSSDNLLRPVLVGRHMQAHALLLFFGILGGIALFGFAGLILGPVVVAFLTVSAKLFRREFSGGEERSSAPA